MEENETFSHLNAMEMKIRHQEANVYHLKEGIDCYSSILISSSFVCLHVEIEQKLKDSDVQAVEMDLKRTLDSYNSMLVKMAALY